MRRLISHLRALDHDLQELAAVDAERDRAEALDLAATTARFTQETRSTVDDELAFSATLMRAGEVQAAQKVLADVERRVAEEQAALLEVVNEVRVARSVRRARISKLRLARTLAAAMIAAVLMGSTALAAALGTVIEDNITEATPDRDDAAAHRRHSGIDFDHTLPTDIGRRMTVAGGTFVLTPEQLRQVSRLLASNASDHELLAAIGASPASLVAQVTDTVSAAAQQVDEVLDGVTGAVRRVKPQRTEAADEPGDRSEPTQTSDDGDSGGRSGNEGGNGETSNGVLSGPREILDSLED